MTDNLPAEQSNLPELARRYPIEQGETALRYITRLMELIPAPDEDTVEKIAAQIISAESMEDENELFEAMGSAKLMGRVFRWDRLTLLPSSYEESPFPYYLGCRVVEVSTGEELFITTGAVNIVTSLVKAHCLGNLPAVAEIVGPRRVPRSGKIPLRLRWLRQMRPVGDQD